MSSGILGYSIRRIIGAIPLLLGLSLIMFSLVHIAPGDPIRAMITPETTDPAFVAQLRKKYGLDKPLPVQYLIYIGNLARGNFGRAITFNGKPVLSLIKERAKATVVLQAVSLAIALMIAIPLGILSATRQYSLLDNTTTVGAFIGLALPNFWLALLLQFYLSVKLGWLPAISTDVANADLLGKVRYSIMPVAVLAFPSIAYFARFMRSAMLEVINQDYMTMARAKGLSDRKVLFRHGFRNALIPMITVTGLQVSRILGGAVIIEKIFAWPGLGSLAYDAITQRDYPVILGVTIVAGAFVIFVNLVVDLLYVIVDPRVSLTR
ncbi:MAG TPA: ABC transporter permease [Thermomicrobiales bacterium]|nr:diguanylate cyclase [Chloroflexota bacterium]HQX63289.1 ABC transporter permease [Thermomicrobiales bacterium]HBY46006.1 diguanylate cyclase [Chloroflexota bacterium]HCG30899.1 diguanylate cyclase [Chloroflexota bacterium]HQZ89035.1 ABC transporter permease [Thermomicrobiales bacterium]